MKALLAVFTVAGLVGVAFLFFQGGIAWLFAFAGLCLIIYLWIVIAREFTGDDNWLPWGGGPVD